MSENPTSIKCSKCKKTKSLEEFWNWKNGPYGKQRECISCSKEKGRRYQRENREYIRKKRKERYDLVEDKEAFNRARYQKYKGKYLESAIRYRTTSRGKLAMLLLGARKRAEKYDMNFNLDINFMIEMYDFQQGKCALTGIPFEFSLRNRDRDKTFFTPFSMSLDKVNHEKGYTKTNVRLVLTAVNLALNEFGEETFAKIAKAYFEHLPNRIDSHKP